jgi:DNA repair exonuclease SbcCD ATPase subunit
MTESDAYTTIFHFADIHLRKGNERFSSYNVYLETIERSLQMVKMSRQKYSGKSACVVCGDVFHHKMETSHPGIALFYKLIFGLAELVDTVILIQGNHDMHQHSIDEHNDMIDALLPVNQGHSYFPQNIHYLKKTGLYEFGNLQFGVVAIGDILRKRSCSGLSDEIPDFPKPCVDRTNVARIALAHCTIQHCIVNGKPSPSGIPINWFAEYDVAMLGDVHIQQITYNQKLNLTYAYPGSLIQQDFGESILGHGFLEWNVDQNNQISIRHKHHVPNSWAMINAKVNDSLQITINLHNQYIPLEEIKPNPLLPKKATVRLNTYGLSTKDAQTQKEYLHHKLLEIKIDPDIEIIHASTNIDSTIDIHTVNDTQSLNTLDTVINFLEETISTEIKDHNPDWKTIVNQENSLKIKDQIVSDNLNPHVKQIIDDKDRNIQTIKAKFQPASNTALGALGIRKLKLIKIKFDWILAFGKNNEFNFLNNQFDSSNIRLVNAPNGYGKSSLFEIVLLAIFGEGIPSRHKAKNGGSILNFQKPSNKGSESSNTSIYFELNNVIYRLKRVFGENIKNDHRNLQIKQSQIHRMEHDTPVELVCDQKTAVKLWINENLCSVKEFMLFNMITQDADMDFLRMDSKTQIEILDNVFHIDFFNQLSNMLKDVRKEYKLAISLLDTYLAGASPSLIQDDIDIDENLDERILRIEKEITDLEQNRTLNAQLTKFQSFDCSENYSDTTEDDVDSLLQNYQELEQELQIAKRNGYESKRFEEVEIPDDIEMSDCTDLSIQYKYDGTSLSTLIKTYYHIEAELTILKNFKTIDRNIPKAKHKPDSSTLYKLMQKYPNPLLHVQSHECSITTEEYERMSDLFDEDTISEIEELDADPDRRNEYRFALQQKLQKLEDELPSKIPKTVPPTQSSDHLRQQIELMRTQHIQSQQIDSIRNKLYLDTKTYNNNCENCCKIKNLAKPLHSMLKSAKSNSSSKQVSMEDIEAMTNTLEIVERQEKDAHNYKKRCKMIKKIERIKTVLDALSKYDSYMLTRDRMNMYVQHLETKQKNDMIREELNTLNTLLSQYTYCLEEKLMMCKSQINNTANFYKESSRVFDIKQKTFDLQSKLAYHAKLQQKIEDHLDTCKESLFKTKNHKMTTLKFKQLESIIRPLIMKLEHRRELMDSVIGSVSKYKTWVYQVSFLPIVVRNTNNVLSTVFGDRALELRFRFEKDELEWRVQDDGNIVAVEKLSGAQKFMASLSIRFGLGAVGGFTCKQLFLDEGFNSFDIKNREKIPLLFKNLRNMFEEIIIVTHLEDIKHLANDVISIQRSNGVSHVKA